VPRLFPPELRTPPRPIHAAEQPWARVQPANPARALTEIAGQVFSEKDVAQIQAFEDELGKADEDRKKHCDSSVIDQKLWDVSQDSKLSPREYAARCSELEKERDAIPKWTLALNKRDAELKEAMRPYALRLAAELPGFIARAISEQEREAGPDGVCRFWGIGQNFDASIIVYPLRRLHELAESWRESLEKNDSEARESRIRTILADSGVLKPKVFVFRSQF
jgi:hypothetical protein